MSSRPPAPTSPGSPPPRRAWSWWLSQAALYALLCVSFFRLPSAPEIGLDSSWQMVLSYASDHGLQHGRDIVFTYGPLGHLMAATYTGSGLLPFLAWQAVSALLTAAGLYAFGRRLSGWRQASYYLCLFWFGSMYVDAMQMSVITIFGLMLVPPVRNWAGWIGFGAAAFAVLSLIKFTHLMLCGALVVLLAGYYLTTGHRRQAGLMAGVFLAVFLLGWLACGQALGNLPDFLYYGLQLSLGYSGAMGTYEDNTMLALGLVAGGSVLAYLALYFVTSPERRQAGFIVAMLGAILFLNWKHGFTRADGHVLAHFVSVLLVVGTYPALTLDRQRWGTAKNFLLGLAALAAFAGIERIPKLSAAEAPARWNDRLRETFAALADFPHYRNQLNAAVQATADAVARPGLAGYIGRERVDHLGADQAFTVLNRFNYVPRPAVQGYATYTPALNRLDEEFYRSDRAPRFVIQRYASVDDRLVALDDSLTQKLLYQNYDFAMEEGGLLLWERPPRLQYIDPTAEKTVLEKTVRFGERIEVPAAGANPQWATIRIGQNLAGRLRQLLYKPPTLRIKLGDDQGNEYDLLFVRAMGEAGFILQPFFSGGDALIAYQQGRNPPNILWFSLETTPGGEAYYQDAIHVELQSLRPFTRASHGLQTSTPGRFRMMNRVPARLSAAAPPMDTFLRGEHLLQMHAPSVMEFEITSPVTSLRAGIGFLDGAYGRPDGTEGVNFIVEWQGADGRVERLGSRFLDPKRRAEDRGRQVLEVDLGGRHDGKLRLRTAPGPSGNTSFAWSYWTALEIE